MEKRREEAMGKKGQKGKGRKEETDGKEGGEEKVRKEDGKSFMALPKRKYPCSFINTQLDKQNYTCAFCVHSIYTMQFDMIIIPNNHYALQKFL